MRHGDYVLYCNGFQRLSRRAVQWQRVLPTWLGRNRNYYASPAESTRADEALEGLHAGDSDHLGVLYIGPTRV